MYCCQQLNAGVLCGGPLRQYRACVGMSSEWVSIVFGMVSSLHPTSFLYLSTLEHASSAGTELSAPMYATDGHCIHTSRTLQLWFETCSSVETISLFLCAVQ